MTLGWGVGVEAGQAIPDRQAEAEIGIMLAAVNRMVAKDTGSATECQADSIVGYLASALGSVN